MADIVTDGGLGLAPVGWPRRFLHLPTAATGLGLTAVTIAVAVLAPVLAPGDPFASVAEPFLRPSAAHPMGTDDLGRDLLGAVVHGTRTSMIVVMAVVAVAALIGIAVGVVAGYGGALVDDLLMRLTDMFQAVPRFFLAILAVALLGPGIDNLILILAVTSWPWLARVVRAETRSLKKRSFVEAARALGATDARILVHHVLPHVLPSIMVIVSLTAGRVILLEASLGFLGLGDPNAMSWGYLANNAQRFLRNAWWMSFFPGLAIVLAVLGFTLLSDAVTALHDPVTGARRPARLADSRGRSGARRAARWLVPAAVAGVVGLALLGGDGGGARPDQPRPTQPPTGTGSGGVAVSDVEVGDCFDQPDNGALEVSPVPCEQPHTDEVFAVPVLEGRPGARYPTQLDDQADGLCYKAFVTFVGDDPDRSTLTYDWYPPTEEAWAAGERRLPCVAADPDGQPRTGPA